MSMAYNAGRAKHIVNGVSTTIDCQKQVRSWRLLRSLIEFLIRSCNCYYFEEQGEVEEACYNTYYYHHHHPHPRRNLIKSNTTVMGTIFGHRRGKVSLCIQANSNTSLPILLLELAVPTAILAKEMQSGLLRIALECHSDTSSSPPLLSVPMYSVCCNGRKVGFAMKRQPTLADMNVLQLVQSVSVGTGILSANSPNGDHELMYLRANFERAPRSTDSESYHLLSPDGSSGQELSIFFHRNR